jgi:hypothetical protein
VWAWLLLAVTLVTLLRRVSPAMVQLIPADKKLCERLIAAFPKCATIVTVKESFPASHGTDFIHGPKAIFSAAYQRQAGN